MNTRLWLPAILMLSLPAAAEELPLNDLSKIQLASAARAAALLSDRDDFIASLSPFDRAVRLQTDREVSELEFLNFVSGCALDWESSERTTVQRGIGRVREKLKAFPLPLPGLIWIAKTSGREEGGAAYCRGQNVIVLPKNKLQSSPERLEGLLLHELFHIYTRNHPKQRDALYQIIGFQAGNDIELPDPLRALKITNPDAPRISHSLEITAQGKTIRAAPVLFSKHPRYDSDKGAALFDYLNFKLLALEASGQRGQPAGPDENPLLYDVSEVENFYEQIGRNTSYIIHPEEILADNFVLMIQGKSDLPTPSIPARMRQILTRNQERHN